MNAISESLHKKFVEHVRQHIGTSDQQSDFLSSDDIRKLEHIHNEYAKLVEQLKVTLERYRLLQNDVRVRLRRHQIQGSFRAKKV